MTLPAAQPAGLLERAAAGALIVTASRRLARTLQLHYARFQRSAGRRAWPTPQILPWSAWIESLWETALYDGLALPARLSADEESLVWERIISDDPEHEALLDPAAAAEAACHSWELMHAWRLDRGAIRTLAGEDTLAFLRWAERFEQISAREGWLEAARQPDRLASLLDRIPLPAPIVLAGFDELTPQQREFVEACRCSGAAVEQAPPPSCTTSLRCRISLPDRAREFEAAARWARALVESGSARTVAIVVPDLESVRAEVERIFTRVLEPVRLLPGDSRPRAFNVAAPPPLLAQPLVRAALLILELDRDRNPVDAVSRLLRSRYLRCAESERAPRALLDIALRDRGLAEISIPELRRACCRAKPACPSLASALGIWLSRDERLPQRQPPSGWARDFTRLLRALGWPGQRSLSSEEYQACEAWNAVLARFGSLDRAAGDLPRIHALALLRRLLARTPHEPRSEPAPIQILGVLETAGLQFDAVWICGLDDDSWPRPPEPDPFIPLELQRRLNLPHASPQRELDFARRTLDRLAASAPRVVASWPRRVEDQDRAPSPLIEAWPEASEAELLPGGFDDYVHLIAASGSLEFRQESGAPPLPEDAWSRGGVRVFQYQALCPFRAFAELRLGATRLRFPQPGISPLDRGHAVHTALELVWRELQSHERLLGTSETDIEALLDRAIGQAIAKLQMQRPDLMPRLLELERRRLEPLLRAWLGKEKSRETFHVVAIEHEREIELAGVRATVKVDRVDRLDDGREIILDYKTGACSRGLWMGERPEDPQLPLYAVTHPNDLAGLFFAQISTGEICLKGLRADRPDARGAPLLCRELLEQWRRVLERLATDFREGRAEVNPKRGEQTCRTCRLEALCRVHETAIEPSESEEYGEQE
ncbi:MAG: PD-(D/E)XK nuclease family protein [Bryobacterales bacterium]|nr:PD-(D/E)XK nuclease family protein [Bryobacterales bacterium]